MNKQTQWIFWGLGAVLLLFGFWSKNYLSLIYFPLGVVVGVMMVKPRPGKL